MRIGLRKQCYTCENIYVDKDDNPVCGLNQKTLSLRLCALHKATDDSAMEGLKCCCSCHKVYDMDDFYLDRKRKDGHDVYCKWCRKMIKIDDDNKRDKAITDEEREARRERHNALNRKWAERQKQIKEEQELKIDFYAP